MMTFCAEKIFTHLALLFPNSWPLVLETILRSLTKTTSPLRFTLKNFHYPVERRMCGEMPKHPTIESFRAIVGPVI